MFKKPMKVKLTHLKENESMIILALVPESPLMKKHVAVNLATLYKMYNRGAMRVSEDDIKFNLSEIFTEDDSVPLHRV